MKHESPQDSLLPHPVYAIVASSLRSLAASIPLCASLGQAWSEYENHRTAQRIQELFANFRAELEGLQHAAAAQTDHMKAGQDSAELLEMTIERVRKEFDEAKRAKYARLLARLLTDGDAHPHGDKVAMIDSLDTLSETDLRVLRLFKGKESCKAGGLEWKTLGLPGDPNEQLWQLACNLARLESRGLVLRVSMHNGVVYVRESLNRDTAGWLETEYRLLPLGRSLIAALFD